MPKTTKPPRSGRPRGALAADRYQTFKSVTLFALIFCAALCYSVSGASSAPVAAVRQAISSPAHAAPAHLANPHIRGGVSHPEHLEHPTKTAESTVDHDPRKPHEPDKELDRPEDHDHDRHWDHLHHHWYYGWSYVTCVRLHRGLGTIRGIVYDSTGHATAGIHLALRTPTGQYIHDSYLRHTVYSGLNGVFIMSGVRLGSYRVRAQVGKTSGHSTALSVHAGSVTFTSVKV